MAKCSAWWLLWDSAFAEESTKVIRHVKNLGFDGVEINLSSEILEKLPIEDLKKKITDEGLSATFCASLDPNQNVASSDKSKRRRGIEHLKKCVETVARFEGNCLAGILYGVWGGFSGFPPTDDELNWSAECVREVAGYAESLGLDLAIEPCSRFECYLIATAEEGLKYIEKVGQDNVGLLLDTFQMNIEEKSLPGAILKAGKKLYHFHVCASDRGIPGTGHIDWDGIFSALKKIGYDRWFTVESFFPKAGSGMGAAAKVWRQLAPTADDIAKGGLNLVRKYMP